MSRIFFHAYADIIESIIAGGIGIRVFLRSTARRSFNSAISNQQHPIVLRESNKNACETKSIPCAYPFKETCIKTECSRIKWDEIKCQIKSVRLFAIFPSLCELSRGDVYIFLASIRVRDPPRDCTKNSGGVQSVAAAFTLLPSRGRQFSRKFPTLPLAPSLTLSVENTQPVGSLLSASPNSWTGILLSERSLLRIPSLERFGVGRRG